eukprot:CAMPEP_0172779856 /NCGR_PEP_ID=MMETSP1074-20121228/202633_1 /TAXON_ID=2916 /ORGANISM="Ceratium fusus, Strain PA161109" /LENGTH=716 /DNA_ID=CAMNT_0013616823 /DNA_START=45 /DNA_END=2196 /DNA_ORIENTATION=+
MRCTCPVLFMVLVSLGLAAASSGAVSTTPIQKVIEMLNGMLVKGKQEKHDEQVQFTAYKQFCDDTLAEKATAVKVGEESIVKLKADIQKANTDAEIAAQKIQECNNDIATWSGDSKAATHLREIEHEQYLKEHKDYTETIDAVTKAYAVIQAKAYNRVQQKDLLFLTQAKGLDKLPEARRVLAAFLANSEEPDDLSEPPEAYAYEHRSTGILDMLEKLKEKFLDERSVLEKEEVQKRHAYELLVQDLKKSIEAAEDTISQKVEQKSKSLQNSATMAGDLEDVTTTLADDKKYRSEMSATCKQKDTDFQDRQKLRTEEIQALGKAIEILSNGKVVESSEKYLTMLQNHGIALVQFGSADHDPDVQMRVADFLRVQGAKINSGMLSAMAVRASEDPFVKVKKMIKDLITRLQEEAGDEAQHKGWCDTELASNEQVRTSRTVDVERLTSEMDSLKANMAQLADEIVNLHAEPGFEEQVRTSRTVDVERLTSEMDSLKANMAQLADEIVNLHAELAKTEEQIGTQTKLRQEQKAENEQTLKDAVEAQAAIEQAVTVLREFYARAAESTALMQQHGGRQPPEIFEGSYKGMASESGGVIGMLEVIQSDYARLESTTTAMETTAQQDFDKQMRDDAVLKVQMEKDIEHKTRQKQTAQQSLVDRGNDFSSAQKELEAATNYYEKLKPSCLDAGMSSEERNRRRQEEIQSLQEALKILNGEELA